MEILNVFNNYPEQTYRNPFSFGVVKPSGESGQILFLNIPSEQADYRRTFLKNIISSYEGIKKIISELENDYNVKVEDYNSVIEYLLMNTDIIEPLKELSCEARNSFDEKLVLSYYKTIEGDDEYLNLFVIQDNNKDLNDFLEKINQFNHHHTSRLFLDKSGLVIVSAEFE